MTSILRRAPLFKEPTLVTVGGEQVVVRPYQIIVWVSLVVRGNLSPRFPAVVDTGFNLTCAIPERQLRTWAALEPSQLTTIGRTRINRQYLDLKRGNVALQFNKPGERDLILDRPPIELSLREGIVVYPQDHPASPRLPLLGTRALVPNGLKFTIDSERKTVHLKQPFGWFGL